MQSLFSENSTPQSFKAISTPVSEVSQLITTSASPIGMILRFVTIIYFIIILILF